MIRLPEEYLALHKERAKGFQTWNVRSVLSHVDVETGYALNVCLKDGANGHYLKEALIGRFGDGVEQVFVPDMPEDEVERWHATCAHIRGNIEKIDWLR